MPSPEIPFQFVVIGNTPKRTYSAHFHQAATTPRDLISVKAPANTVIRIKQIVFTCLGTQTTPGVVDIEFGYANNIGSGGASATIHNYGVGDGDPSSGCTAREGDTTPAAGFVPLGHLGIAVTGSLNSTSPYDFQFHAEHKSPTINGNLAAANTFSIRHPGSAGATNMVGFIEWTEEHLPA